MQHSDKIIEPNFEGAPMKMPTASSAKKIEAPAGESILSAPIIILLFLILVAILAGLLYWYLLVTKPSMLPGTLRPTAEQNNEPESTTAEARTGVMDVVSTSDELSAIKADLESTFLGDLNAEVQPIKAELDAALAAQ
jgi:flagellar basal body-associated protein FliL